MNRITIIVGAGASKEFDLLDGWELREKIAEALDIRFNMRDRPESGDEQVIHAFRVWCKRNLNTQSTDPLRHAFSHIASSVHQVASIDDFIDIHRDKEHVALCGKVGIARCILQAERGSTIVLPDDNPARLLEFRGLAENWIQRLFQRLTTGVTLDGLVSRLKQLSLIVFNYDRCVEHYLHQSVRNMYQMDDNDAADILGNLSIIHPYGSIGSLPWQDSGNNVPFGLERAFERLLSIAEDIKTYTEQIENKEALSRIRNVVANADRLIFLGFAFHSQNLKIIKAPPNKDIKTNVIYGTAYRMSEPDRRSATRLLQTFQEAPNAEHTILNRKTRAFELFDEYSRDLLPFDS